MLTLTYNRRSFRYSYLLVSCECTYVTPSTEYRYVLLKRTLHPFCGGCISSYYIRSIGSDWCSLTPHSHSTNREYGTTSTIIQQLRGIESRLVLDLLLFERKKWIRDNVSDRFGASSVVCEINISSSSTIGTIAIEAYFFGNEQTRVETTIAIKR